MTETPRFQWSGLWRGFISPRQESVFHRRNVVLLLAAILMVGGAFRMIQVGSNPPGLFCDEAMTAMNGKSIFKTGRDLDGRWFPLLSSGFGEWPGPIQPYLAGPFVSWFGMNETALRLPFGFVGVVSIFAAFLLGLELFGASTGLVLALVFATAPWVIHLNRTAMMGEEYGLATLFLVTLLRARRSPEAWPWVALLGALTFYSYPPARFHALAIGGLAAIFFFRNYRATLRGRPVWIAGAITAWFAVATLRYATAGVLFARWDQVQGELRTASQFVSVWLQHFSTTFLYTVGEAGMRLGHVSRHSWFVGALPLFTAPFLLVGLWRMVFPSGLLYEAKVYRFFFLLMLLAPIPASLISTEASASRSEFLIVPLAVFVALGATAVLHARSRWRHAGALTLLLGAFYAIGVDAKAMREYPARSDDWMGWQYGYRQAVEMGAAAGPEYKSIFVTHRFNRGEAVMDFYKSDLHCPRCRVMPNPIAIHPKDRELFFIRPEDVAEADRLYPALAFKRTETIRGPSGRELLFVGEFISKNGVAQRSTAAEHR